MTDLEQSPASEHAPLAPLEFRSSSVGAVNFAQRTIELVAVPYDEETTVEYRGELWQESFAPGAFDGIEKRPNRVRANRDHDKRRTIGRVINFWPSRQEGLVAAVRIAKTDLGDETLALADDEAIGASVGFGVLGSGQELDRRNRKRRVNTAWVDHLAFTSDEAYTGAKILNIREGVPAPLAADLPPLNTPALDELRDWYRALKG